MMGQQQWRNNHHSFSIGTYVLISLIGSSVWLCTNSLYNELSVLTKALPEEWSLPSQVTAVGQLASLIVLISAVVCRVVNERLREKKRQWSLLQHNKSEKQHNFSLLPAAIHMVLLMAAGCALAMAHYWRVTTIVWGEEHSIVFIVLAFGISLANTASNLLFLPYMSRFPARYTTAYFFGSGAGVVLASGLALLQGAGEVDGSEGCFTPVGSDEVVARERQDREGRFSFRTYMLVIVGWMCLTMLGFARLNWTSSYPLAVSKKRKSLKDASLLLTNNTASLKSPMMTRTMREKILLNSISSLFVNNAADDEEKAQLNMEASITTTTTTDSLFTEKAKEEEEESDQTDLVYGARLVDTSTSTPPPPLPTTPILLQLALLSALCSSVVPSVQPYASLPHSLRSYHLSLNVSCLLLPAAALLPAWTRARVRSMAGISALTALNCAFAIGIVVLALWGTYSREAVGAGTAWGEVLPVALATAVYTLGAYLRTLLPLLLSSSQESEARRGVERIIDDAQHLGHAEIHEIITLIKSNPKYKYPYTNNPLGCSHNTFSE